VVSEEEYNFMRCRGKVRDAFDKELEISGELPDFACERLVMGSRFTTITLSDALVIVIAKDCEDAQRLAKTIYHCLDMVRVLDNLADLIKRRR